MVRVLLKYILKIMDKEWMYCKVKEANLKSQKEVKLCCKKLSI